MSPQAFPGLKKMDLFKFLFYFSEDSRSVQTIEPFGHVLLKSESTQRPFPFSNMFLFLDFVFFLRNAMQLLDSYIRRHYGGLLFTAPPRITK